MRRAFGVAWRVPVSGVAAAALVSTAMIVSSGAAVAVPPEGCVLSSPSGPVVQVGNGGVGSSCSYTATQVATFTGVGPFHIRDTYQLGDGSTMVRFDITEPAGSFSFPVTGLSDPYTVDIGDHVDASVTGSGGFLAVGNPGAVPSSGPHTPPQAPRLAVSVHDPDMAYWQGSYYLFGTGAGIPVQRSQDLVHWQAAGTVFPDDLPAWASQVVPGATVPWAPDVAYFDGEWHLYYAISTFGSQRSAIGLALNTTLDRTDPRYAWRDQGPVIVSAPTSQPAGAFSADNAIDPSVVFAGGLPYLEFGSFGAGLGLVALHPRTGRPIEPMVPVPLAANAEEGTAVEGGYMIRHSGYYYLFASYDFCCQGTSSDYNVRVGRSRSPFGPYFDDLGIPMLAGGGRYVLDSNGDMRGPGGEGVITVDGQELIYFHYYDATNGGAPTLGILPLRWTKDGWPVAY